MLSANNKYANYKLMEYVDLLVEHLVARGCVHTALLLCNNSDPRGNALVERGKRAYHIKTLIMQGQILDALELLKALKLSEGTIHALHIQIVVEMIREREHLRALKYCKDNVNILRTASDKLLTLIAYDNPEDCAERGLMEVKRREELAGIITKEIVCKRKSTALERVAALVIHTSQLSMNGKCSIPQKKSLPAEMKREEIAQIFPHFFKSN